MKKLALILFLVPFLTLAHGQKSLSKQMIELPDNLHERLDLSGSYYGNSLWNPGLKFGAEYIWKEKRITKSNKKGRSKAITKQKILSGDLGFYWDPQSHTGVFNYYGIIFRRTSSKNNRHFDFKLNPLGYYHSFLPETYKVSGNDVKKVTLPGRGYYSPSFSIGTGKLRRGKALKAHFVNLNFMFLIKYNTTVNPLISLDFGFRFSGKKRSKIAEKDN